MKQILILIVTVFATLPLRAQYEYTLRQCLEEGLLNNYSLRISRNEEQTSKNNATLGNAGYLPTVDFTAGYTGDLNNSDSKLRADGSTASERNVLDHTLDAGIDLNWTIFDGFNISTTYKQLQELERQGATNTRIAIEDFIATLTAEYYNYPARNPSEKLPLRRIALERTFAHRGGAVSHREFFAFRLPASHGGFQCR